MDLLRNVANGFDVYTTKKAGEKGDKAADRPPKPIAAATGVGDKDKSEKKDPKQQTAIAIPKTVPSRDPFAELAREEKEKAEREAEKHKESKKNDAPSATDQPKLLRKKSKPQSTTTTTSTTTGTSTPPAPITPSTPDPNNTNKRKSTSPAHTLSKDANDKKLQEMMAELEELRRHNTQLSELNSMLGHENETLIKRSGRGSIPRSISNGWQQNMDDEEATPTSNMTPTPTSTIPHITTSNSSYSLHPHIHHPLTHRSHLSSSSSHHSISSLTIDPNATQSEVEMLKQQLEQTERRVADLLIDKKVADQTIQQMRQVAADIDQVHNSSYLALQSDFNEMERKYWEKERIVNEQQTRIAELQDALAKSRAATETELNLFNLEVEREIARSKGEKERIKLTQQLKEQELSYQKLKKLYDQLKITKGIPAGYVANGVEESEYKKVKEEKENLSVRLEEVKKREKKLSETVEQFRLDKQSLEKQLKEKASTSSSASTSTSASNPAEIAALNATISSLQSQLATATTASSTSTSSAASDATITSLQQKLTERDNEYQQLESKYQSTSTELSTSLSTITSLRTELATITSQFENLRREHSIADTSEHERDTERQKQIQELQTQVTTLQQQTITMQSEHEQAERKWKESTETQSQEIEQMKRVHKNEVEEVNTKMTQMKDEMTKEMEQIKENAKNEEMKQLATIGSLTTTLATRDTTITELSTRISTLQHEYDELTHEIEEHVTTIQAMKEQEQKQWLQIADLQHSLESKSEEHDLLLKHALQLQNELESTQQQLTDLTRTLENERQEYKTKSDALQQAIIKLTDEKTYLQQQLTSTTTTWKQEIKEWEEKYVDLQHQHDDTIRTWEDEKHSWEEEKHGLQQEIESRDSDIHGLRTTIASLDAEKTRLEGVVQQKIAALKIYHDEIRENARKKQELSTPRPGTATPPRRPVVNPLAKLREKLIKHKDEDNKEDDVGVGNINMFDENGNHVDDSIRNELSEEIAVALSTRLEKVESERTRLQHEIDEIKRQLAAEQYMIQRMRDGDEEAWRGKNKTLKSTSTSTTDVNKLLTQTLNVNKELENKAKLQDAEIRRLKQRLQVREEEIKELAAAAHH